MENYNTNLFRFLNALLRLYERRLLLGILEASYLDFAVAVFL